MSRSPFEVTVPLVGHRLASGSDARPGSPEQFGRALSRTGYLFCVGCVVYVFAWVPVLCRITLGVTRYPDRMPIPVWVSVLGIVFFYELFIFAQCTSVAKRVAAAWKVYNAGEAPRKGVPGKLYEDLRQTEEPWSMLIIWVLSFPDWRTIAIIAAGVSIDLVSAVVLVIPSVREGLFSNTNEQSRAEPYAMLTMLTLIWACSPLVLRLFKYVESSSVLAYASAYIFTGGAFFFGWGFLIQTDLVHTDVVWPWTAALAVNALLVGVVLVVTTKTVHLSPDGDGGYTRESTDTEFDIKVLANAHKWAGVMHVALIAFTLYIGTNRDGVDTFSDWWNDWLFMSEPLFLLMGDWELVSKVKDDPLIKPTIALASSGQYRLDYCTTGKSMPVYLVLLSMGWSTASATQHFCSYRTLTGSPALVRGSVASNALVAGVVSFVVALLIANNVHTAWYTLALLTALLFTLVAPAMWATAFGVEGASNELTSAQTDNFQRIRTTRRYKWIEYTFSATFMHVVVMFIGGVKGAHEVVLACAVLATSMLFPGMMDAHVDSLEDTIEFVTSGRSKDKLVGDHVDTEKPFVFLSFFAKAILTIALSLPMVFINRGDYTIEPVPCFSSTLP